MTINTYDQLRAAGGGIAICPQYTDGRKAYRNGWIVYRVNAAGERVNTDPQAHWLDHGCKHFGEVATTRAEALEEAKHWVAETYGELGPWVKNRIWATTCPSAFTRHFR